MRNVTILNASTRCDPNFWGDNNSEEDHITIPGNYDIKISKKSICSYFANEIMSKISNECNDLSIRSNPIKLKFVEPCMVCYSCIATEGKCSIDDIMTECLYDYLDDTQELVIISPLYYGTISPHLISFFTRLYKYHWTKSLKIDPSTGLSIIYPKLNVTVIGTCIDPWQDWKVYDDTLIGIFKEFGWNLKGIFHSSGKNSELVNQAYMTILKYD